jgi:hypothetical protein
MGRGRAKAKQIKVARKLKYSAPETDLSALERELRASRGESDSFSSVDDDTDDDDTYASDEDDDQDDYGSWTSNGHR